MLQVLLLHHQILHAQHILLQVPPQVKLQKTATGKSVKTKNSTNRERGSVLTTMDKIATCFEAAGNKSTDSGGLLSMMLLMQQQMSQQQQM